MWVRIGLSQHVNSGHAELGWVNNQRGPGVVNAFYSTETHAPVPEPTTWLLFGTGLLGLAGLGRKKFFKKA